MWVFTWMRDIFLKNCIISLFLLCCGLRQPFVTLFETTIFFFSRSDLKMVPGRDYRGKHLNCMAYVHTESYKSSNLRSTSVMQMFQIIFTSCESVAHKQGPECGVLDREITVTSLWPSHQILKIRCDISVSIKSALLLFLYPQLHKQWSCGVSLQALIFGYEDLHAKTKYCGILKIW